MSRLLSNAEISTNAYQLIVDSWENIKDHPYKRLGNLVSNQGLIVIADALFRYIATEIVFDDKGIKAYNKTEITVDLRSKFDSALIDSLPVEDRFVHSYQETASGRAVGETRFWLEYGNNSQEIEYSLILNHGLSHDQDIAVEWYNILVMAYHNAQYLPYLEQGIYDLDVIKRALDEGIDISLLKAVS